MKDILDSIPLDKDGCEIHKGDIVLWQDPEGKASDVYEVYEEPTEDMVKLCNPNSECEALPEECIIIKTYASQLFEIPYCPICGSSNTSSKAWVHNRTGIAIERECVYDSDDNYCEDCKCNTSLRHIGDLWDMFAEIEFDEDLRTKREFLSFPKHTEKQKIVKWFGDRGYNV